MVGANAIWMVWFLMIPVCVTMQGPIWHLFDNCMYCVIILVQSIALYLSFDFATAWYHRLCPEAHKLCEKCCVWLLVKHLERDIELEYVLMLEFDPPERERAVHESGDVTVFTFPL